MTAATETTVAAWATFLSLVAFAISVFWPRRDDDNDTFDE